MMNLCQAKSRNCKLLRGTYWIEFMIILDWDKNMPLVHFYKRNLIHQKDLE